MTTAAVLHEDDPTREGNLTAEEYWEAYEALQGGPCRQIPDDVLAAALEVVEAPGFRPGATGADADLFIPAGSIGGRYASGQPRLYVIHDLECPVRPGLVEELARGWLQTAGVSPHGMAGPDRRVECVRDDRIGFHVRSPGNEISHGEEHAGYASNTLEQWTTGAQWQVLKIGARNTAEKCAKLGIPLRWLSIAQIRDGVSRGLCTHADISVAFKTTDHTDPGRNFPFEAYLRTAQQYQGDYSSGGSNTPNPQPTGGKGGAAARTYLEELLHW